MCTDTETYLEDCVKENDHNWHLGEYECGGNHRPGMPRHKYIFVNKGICDECNYDKYDDKGLLVEKVRKGRMVPLSKLQFK